MKQENSPFWHWKSLHQFTRIEWESICDRCGRCCLQKLENKKTGKVYYTWVACYLLDTHTCLCSQYEFRDILVPDCINLSPDNIKNIRWLPKTCAYRKIAEGHRLDWWHPLISGNYRSVHEAGVSVRDKAFSETLIHPDDLDYYTIKIPF